MGFWLTRERSSLTQLLVATWAGLSAVAILNHFPQNETTEQWLKTNLTGLSSMLAFGAWCGECNLSQGLLKKEKVA